MSNPENVVSAKHDWRELQPQLTENVARKISLRVRSRNHQHHPRTELQRSTSTTMVSSPTIFEIDAQNRNDQTEAKSDIQKTDTFVQPQREFSDMVPDKSPSNLAQVSNIAESKHSSRQSSLRTPLTAFSMHRGEDAKLHTPAIGVDLNTRLQGLQQFRKWADRIHTQMPHSRNATQDGVHAVDDVQEVKHASGDARATNQRVVPSDLSGCDRNTTPRIIQSSLYRDFSQTQSYICQKPAQSVNDHSSMRTITIGTRVLPADDTSGPARGRRGRSTSRTIIITSTPQSELLRQARSRSISSSRSNTRLDSKDKRYPPVSFPIVLNPQDVARSSSVKLRRNSSAGPATRSVSPSTRAEYADLSGSTRPDPAQPTPTDDKGKPAFYTTIHHYTKCPHACPPASRPLNADAQPRPDLDFHPANPTITRSIIPGRCFNCDTEYRRNQENSAIAQYEGRVSTLVVMLSTLLSQLELENDESDDEEGNVLDDRHAARLHSRTDFAEDASDGLAYPPLPPISDDPGVPNTPAGMRKRHAQIEHQDRVVKEVREIEAQIDRVREQQDEKIKEIWKGYTPRWGPATLGVQRRKSSHQKEQYPQSNEHKSRTVSNDVGPGSRSQQITPRRRSSSTAKIGIFGSNYRVAEPETPRSVRSVASGSSAMSRDVPGSRTPGEGKMRVGWIRE